ncbi:ladinin-1 [Pelodytes ibericus]
MAISLAKDDGSFSLTTDERPQVAHPFRLAKQWSEDDEEEQIRERRRRNRVLSNPADRVVEVLPENTDSSSSPSTMSSVPSTGNRGKLKTKKVVDEPEQLQADMHLAEEGKTELEKQNNQLLISQTEETKQPENTRKEHQLPKSQVNEDKRPTCKTEQSQYSRSKKEEKSPKWGSQSEENKVPICPKEDSARAKTHKEVSMMPEAQLKDRQASKIQKEPTQAQSPVPSSKKEHTLKDGAETMISNTKTAACGQDAGSPPSITRIASVAVNVSLPSPEVMTKSNSVTSSSSGNSSRYKSQVFVSSVKIPRRPSGSDGRHLVLSPPPVPEEEPLPPLRTIKRTEVQMPTPTLSTSPNSKQDELPTSPASASSSFRRFSPRTTSFRVISQSEDQVESGRGLTRSSSLRISLRSQKLEDRLEKYTSAAQRSGSVKLPPTHNRSIPGSSDGIASKKSIFERDQNTAGIATNPRKDLALSGSVSSRITQWSSKNQQGPGTSAGTKDFKAGDVALKRNMWQQRSQSSSDTKTATFLFFKEYGSTCKGGGRLNKTFGKILL